MMHDPLWAAGVGCEAQYPAQDTGWHRREACFPAESYHSLNCSFNIWEVRDGGYLLAFQML